jgi:hypothetical protein
LVSDSAFAKLTSRGLLLLVVPVELLASSPIEHSSALLRSFFMILPVITIAPDRNYFANEPTAGFL